MDKPRGLYQIQGRSRQLLPEHLRRGPRWVHSFKRRLLMAQHRQLPKLVLPRVELRARGCDYDDLRPQGQEYQVYQGEHG